MNETLDDAVVRLRGAVSRMLGKPGRYRLSVKDSGGPGAPGRPFSVVLEEKKEKGSGGEYWSEEYVRLSMEFKIVDRKIVIRPQVSMSVNGWWEEKAEMAKHIPQFFKIAERVYELEAGRSYDP